MAKFIPRFYYEGPFTSAQREKEIGEEEEEKEARGTAGRPSSPSPHSFLDIAPNLLPSRGRLREPVPGQLTMTRVEGRLQRGGSDGEVKSSIGL